jgi:catechol 2,3-dioxygenase-like lactoylglutathione lyase family enzyme
MDQRVSLITLGVSDVDRAAAFYGALGWTGQAPEGADVVFFQAGGMVLALWGREHLAADSGIEPSPINDSGWGGMTLAHNVETPAAVDEAIGEARAAGARIVREPGETFWGGYSAAFHDLDGHPWEIARNPMWTLAPDGSVRLPAAD